MRLRKPEEYTDRGGRRAATIRGRDHPLAREWDATPVDSVRRLVRPHAPIVIPALRLVRVPARPRRAPCNCPPVCVCVNIPDLFKLSPYASLETYATEYKELHYRQADGGRSRRSTGAAGSSKVDRP